MSIKNAFVVALMCGGTLLAQDPGQGAPAPAQNPPSGYGPDRYGPSQAQQAPMNDPQGYPQGPNQRYPYRPPQGQQGYPQQGYPQQQGMQQPPMGNMGNMPNMATPTGDLTLPAGTLLSVRINQVLSSDHNQPGDGFSATLVQPLVANGFVVAARGQSVVGRVTKAEKAGRVKGVSKLGVELGELTFVDGQQTPVRTELVEQRGDTSQGRDAAGIATTTGLGAAIGASVNGGVGAGVGAAGGLVAGIAGVLLTRGHETVIFPEQMLTFRTTTPITISTTRSAAAFVPVSPQDYENASYRSERPRLATRYEGRYYDGPAYATYYNPYYGFYPGYGYGYGYYAGPTFFFRTGHYGGFRGYRR